MDLYFFVDFHKSEYNLDLQAWKIDGSSRIVSCVNSEDLIHECPLPGYEIDSEIYIPLKYCLFDLLGWNSSN